MKRTSMICGLAAAALLVPACVGSAGASPRSEAAARVRALQRQVEENDRQIRELEGTLHRMQAKPAAPNPSRSAVAPVPSVGEISAWSTESPGSTPRAATAPAPTLPKPAPTAIVEGTPSPATRTAAAPAAAGSSRRRKNALAGVALKPGMSQEKVWELLGPPEFVRGRRTSAQYWHYGPGWIRFQAGRITRWTAASNEMQASAAQ